ncbi:MAG: hypothetical protein JW841_07135 [Deltaproteobacteria bacterium]|nr:hypothetical protein [Deltaproteobacteria bacterium]
MVVPDYTARISFVSGAAEIMTWYDADAARRSIDAKFDTMLDRIINDSQRFYQT